MNKTEKMNTIIKMVMNRYNTIYDSAERLSIDDIKGRSRIGRKNKARIMTATVIRNLTDASLSEIGNFIGGRDHASVLHLTTTAHESFYFHDPVYKIVYEDVISKYLGDVDEYEYVMYDIRSYAQKVIRLEGEVFRMKSELMHMMNGTTSEERVTFKRKKLIEELNQLEHTI